VHTNLCSWRREQELRLAVLNVVVPTHYGTIRNPVTGAAIADKAWSQEHTRTGVVATEATVILGNRFPASNLDLSRPGGARFPWRREQISSSR
jgi:hypothetical protein